MVASDARIGLPPTPPAQGPDKAAHEQPAQHHDPLLVQPSSDRLLNPQLPRGLHAMTPVNQRSPPTPDRTPPATQASALPPRPPLTSEYSSSRAESFTTAREDVSSEDSS